jgi:murein DD-endopeptidase MepM/ murein hydrolase activator NlpD
MIAAALATAAVTGVPGPAASQTPEIEAARERANAVAADYGDAESRVGELEQQIGELRARSDEATAAVDALRGEVREVAVASYVAGSRDAAPLLGTADLNDAVRMRTLSRFMAGDDLDDIERFRAALEDAEAAGDELDAALDEERDAVEQLRERRAALEAELARLEEVEAQRQAEERRRQEEEARRQTVAAGRTSSTPDDDERPAPTLSSGGGIVCPVAGAHTFVDSWGAPRSGGRRHQGVDMMARPGVPTVAPVSGRVEHRGNSTGGMSWHLYGDNGDYYYGTHLSAYENQGAGHVEAGTVIGYVGDSGNARGISHLHFEIHPGGGGAVNPYPAVAGAC